MSARRLRAVPEWIWIKKFCRDLARHQNFFFFADGIIKKSASGQIPFAAVARSPESGVQKSPVSWRFAQAGIPDMSPCAGRDPERCLQM
jgi:hypothetical protein